MCEPDIDWADMDEYTWGYMMKPRKPSLWMETFAEDPISCTQYQLHCNKESYGNHSNINILILLWYFASIGCNYTLELKDQGWEK